MRSVAGTRWAARGSEPRWQRAVQHWTERGDLSKFARALFRPAPTAHALAVDARPALSRASTTTGMRPHNRSSTANGITIHCASDSIRNRTVITAAGIISGRHRMNLIIARIDDSSSSPPRLPHERTQSHVSATHPRVRLRHGNHARPARVRPEVDPRSRCGYGPAVHGPAGCVRISSPLRVDCDHWCCDADPAPPVARSASPRGQALG